MAAQACHDNQTMTKSAPGAAEDSTVSSGVEMCDSSVSDADEILVKPHRVMEGDFLYIHEYKH